MTTFTRVLVALVLSVSSASAFVPCPSALTKSNHPAIHDPAPAATTAVAPRPRYQQHAGPLLMGWGDALGKAFANEDMAPKKNPGLKNAPNTCMVTVNGKTIQAVQGQRLRDVVLAAKAKIEYGCEKGDCGTCESIVDGRKIRICKAIVPRNKTKVNIKTKFG
ncbi:unnamed protein product [Ectocarpus sp. 8 AP-2014]